MLEAKGHLCDTASNGAKGLQYIQKRLELVKLAKAQMYALVLLDYSMPEMDGPQVARQLRHTLDEHSDIGV